MNLRTIDANMSSGIGNEMVKLPDDFENYISHIYLIKKKKSHYNRGCKNFAFFFSILFLFSLQLPEKGMHTICLRSPIDESSPLPYKSIRQPLENAHSCQALCSLMAVLRASAAHRFSETFPMRLVVAREYANWGAFQHAFTRRAGASVAATSAWFDAVAAGTENAHMQSAESCN